MNKSALQVLSGVAAVGLSLGVAAPANALGVADNVHNVAGGGVNIHADNTCVEKIGDTAHVKFMVQHQPLLRSSDHMQTSAHGTLALPSAMKNVSIKLKAVGGSVQTWDKDTGVYGDEYHDATVFDTPLDIPILENSDEYKEKYPYGPPTLGGRQRVKTDDGWKDDPDSTPSTEKSPDPENPDLVYFSTVWAEQEVRDYVEKYNVHMKKTPQGFWYNNGAPVPFMHPSFGDTPWYGTEYTKDYDLYEFGNVMMPVTFEVEGDVPVEQEDTFVTAAVSNLGWKSSMESSAGNYEMGSQSLQDSYQWARPNQLPPAIPKTEDMIQLYKDKLSDDGLDISPTIMPTREMPGDSKYSYIGSDIRRSARGDAGEMYSRTFTLHANRAVTYIGQVDTSGEDGADITAAHVELCETPPTTTKQLIPEPSTEPAPTTTKKLIPEPSTEPAPTTTKQLIPEPSAEPAPSTTKRLIPEPSTKPTPTTTKQLIPEPSTEPSPTTTRQLIPEPSTEPTPTTKQVTPEPSTESAPTTTKQLIPEPSTEPTPTTMGQMLTETDTPEAETETETPEKETSTTTQVKEPETDTPDTETPQTEKSRRELASTGASVIGMSLGAIALIAAGIFLIRRKKQS